MKKLKEEQKEKIGKNGKVYRNAIQLVTVGGLTGICAGGVVSLFTLLAEKGEEISRDLYAYVRLHPVFIPLVLAVLALGAFLLGAIVKISPVIKGCGIPQAEGAARGAVHFKWYRDATAMFAASLMSIFFGLPIGSEGPSAEIGSAMGDGVSSLLRRGEMIRRYQVTGGACAGLAVASNAPLTGMAFAFEEAHKRFTPEVFICAFSSVICAMLVWTGVYSAFGVSSSSSFHSYIFHEMPLSVYGYVLISAAVCGLLGIAFYKTCFFFRRRFKRLKVKKSGLADVLKILIAVLAGGTASLITADAMGGGHILIESLGTFGGARTPETELVFGLPLVWTLFIVSILKFFTTSINVASGIPCGIFIPIIAIGACVGGLGNCLWLKAGMSAEYADLMVMICMAAFFTSTVKAPITGIIMICEFTCSFAPLMPVIIGVSIGYLIGDIPRTDGIYEALLEDYEEEQNIKVSLKRVIYELEIHAGSIADGREVRDVLWPSGVRITEIKRGEERIIPDGEVELLGGDMITAICQTSESEKVKEDLLQITGGA